MNAPEILVLGAGVSGLTTATALVERGHRVRIRARESYATTVSTVAGAIWYPYLAFPRERVLPWALRTREAFAALVDEPAAGVSMVEVFELHREPQPPPWWAAGLDHRRAEAPELPHRDFVTADVAWVPVVASETYLPWLERRFRAAGGRLELAPAVNRIEELTGEAPIVVNCTGLGARELVGDDQLRPVRGQVVRLTNPGFDRAWLDQDHTERMCYLIPRGDDCVVGGTSEPDETDTTPDPETTAGILERAQRIVPSLADAKVLAVKVGLRPSRPEVRLERERMGRALVIHNYGHGGSGFTLSWGCAEQVVDWVGAHRA